MSPWEARLRVAREAVESAGAGLLRLPRGVRAEEKGDQLKTAADQASESWVIGYLRAYYPDDRLLAEEDFEARGKAWDAPRAYWTIDALDGTRSFVDGFDGFCVQVAYVEDGLVRVGVVHEPVADCTYFAVAGSGSYRQVRGQPAERLTACAWKEAPRFVDSTRPTGPAGEWFRQHQAVFVELGSIGLKICRVADGRGDVFAKQLRFKLWDVAPGALILAEAGGRLGVWGGGAVRFDGAEVHYRDIVATHAARWDEVARDLVS
jgi:fructose-1,6-bisphosphatase/inositol monophosphatase family enzyme